MKKILLGIWLGLFVSGVIVALTSTILGAILIVLTLLAFIDRQTISNRKKVILNEGFNTQI